jgi:phosphatidylserine/phosphatidylglycerophosphate/cardiolipin synthase-like enzyme
MKLKYFLIILIIILLIGIILVEKSDDQIKNKLSEKTGRILYENGTLDVYFCPEEDCNTIILDEINSSEKIKCAFFELTDTRIQALLVEKNASMIIHYENYKNYGFSRETNGLMHDKFCVLDDKKIITGSHNPTNNKNKDNVLIIESEYLAQNYNDEFENLQKYSALEKEKTKNTRIIFNDYELENYFCPQDSCQKQILEELNKANTSIYFLTYTFTDKDIANLLVRKKDSGLEVRGITESYQGKTYWVYPILELGNVPVVLDNEQTLQHNKVFIIDNKTVVTGSFNPTIAADTKNDENIIILRQPDIVKEYVDNFEHLYVGLQE